MAPGIERISGGFVTRKGDLLIYFGMPLQPFDDVPDAGGRVRLEKLYKALFDMESAIIAKLSPAPAGITALRYRETITDEDRLETYKLMAMRVEVEG